MSIFYGIVVFWVAFAVGVYFHYWFVTRLSQKMEKTDFAMIAVQELASLLGYQVVRDFKNGKVDILIDDEDMIPTSNWQYFFLKERLQSVLVDLDKLKKKK